MTQDPFETGDGVFHEMIARQETRPPEDREPLPEENRGSWYCPCATERHERFIRPLVSEFDLHTVFDLGAGDLRLSAALSDCCRVVAYETNEELARLATERHGGLGENVEVRLYDYYEDWENIRNQNALFAAIGKTNKLPGAPTNGIGVEGADELRVVFPESEEDQRCVGE